MSEESKKSNISRADMFQSIGTVLALVISIIAMIASIYQTNIMKTEQKAMVWPYIDFFEMYDKDGFNLTLTNKGTGPALVKSIQVEYKNHIMSSMDELLDSLNPNRTFGYDILRNTSISGYVFSPGEEVVMMGLPYNDETRIVLSKLKDVRIRLMYESVLGEQWVFDSEDKTVSQKKFKAQIEFKN